MSKLTLEQAKKIGHLFPGSRDVILYNGDVVIAELPSKLADEHPSYEHCEFCRDPSLEEMLDWIFDNGGYNIFKTWFGVSKFWAENSTGNESFFIGIQLDWTEAAYKAICIIEGIEP